MTSPGREMRCNEAICMLRGMHINTFFCASMRLPTEIVYIPVGNSANLSLSADLGLNGVAVFAFGWHVMEFAF